MRTPSTVAKTSTRRMVALSALVVGTVYLALNRVLARLTGFGMLLDDVIEATLLTATTAAVLWLAVIRPLRR